jgi:hypothetical protein
MAHPSLRAAAAVPAYLLGVVAETLKEADEMRFSTKLIVLPEVTRVDVFPL